MGGLKLYEITQQFKEIERLDEFDELPAEVMRDTLDGLVGTFESKATNIAMYVRNLEASADAIESAAQAMKERAARIRRRSESIKAYLLWNFQATGITRVECPEFTVTVRNNPEAVRIADDAELPPEYLVQPPAPPPRPDKTAIKAALKAGKDVPGCWLEAGQRVEIRS
jgi:hypothetical protein